MPVILIANAWGRMNAIVTDVIALGGWIARSEVHVLRRSNAEDTKPVIDALSD